MRIIFYALAPLLLVALSAGVVTAVPDRNYPLATDQSSQRSVDAVFAAIHEHDFHPVDDESFTIDRHLETHGIADLHDNDWRVRLLAVRDLVRAGPESISDIIRGLAHGDVQVLYVAAVSLGILGRKSATKALEKTALNDPDALVRSAAAVATGNDQNG